MAHSSQVLGDCCESLVLEEKQASCLPQDSKEWSCAAQDSHGWVRPVSPMAETLPKSQSSAGDSHIHVSYFFHSFFLSVRLLMGRSWSSHLNNNHPPTWGHWQVVKWNIWDSFLGQRCPGSQASCLLERASLVGSFLLKHSLPPWDSHHSWVLHLADASRLQVTCVWKTDNP